MQSLTYLLKHRDWPHSSSLLGPIREPLFGLDLLFYTTTHLMLEDLRGRV